MNEKNNYSNHMCVAKDILIPVFVYFLFYSLALMGLTSVIFVILRNLIVQENENNIRNIIVTQEATIKGIIGGVSMLIGIIPLISSFRKEINRKEIKKTQSKQISKRINRIPISILLTVVLAVTSSITINILFIRLHILDMSETYSQVSENQYSVMFLFGLFLYGVVSPLAEEVVFRGIVYNRMKKYFSLKVSIVLSACFFGIYHANLVQGIYGLLMGVLIAYVYEKFGSFFYAFLFHAAANIAVYTVTSYEALYRIVMTPYACVILAMLLAVVLAVILRWEKNQYDI